MQIETVICWKQGRHHLHWVLVRPSAGLASKAADYELTVVVRDP